MKSTTPPERLPIGQLLVNLLRLFRAELASRGEAGADVEGIRPAHLQVFGVIKANGSRLTELADSAGLSLSSMAELIDDLESLGYVRRQPDPSDRRAKLIGLTPTGWRAIKTGRAIIEQIEHEWGTRISHQRFATMCQAMQDLLDELDHEIRRDYVTPGDESGGGDQVRPGGGLHLDG
jgi:DNA-binding MarR family transcriptional regulator